MRIVIQRVKQCKIKIENEKSRQIAEGLLVLLGIENSDNEKDADWLIPKLLNMRLFNDEANKMNLSIDDIDGEIMLVSQFTLYASTKKGNRPSYIHAARPEIAMPLYDYFLNRLKVSLHNRLKHGTFGAYMQLYLINDGPVTVIVDSKTKE